MKAGSLLIALLFSVAGIGVIHAQCSLDQNQPQWDGGTSERNLPGYYDWESFTAGMSGALCEVDVMFCNSGAAIAGTGTLDIYDGTGDGGTLLATQSVNVDGSSYGINSPFWQPFVLASPPSVVTGQVYTWKFTPTQGGGLPDPYLIQVNIPDVYAGGVSYGFGAGGDITFATYVDVSLGMNSPVIEKYFDVYPQPVRDLVHIHSAWTIAGQHYSIFDGTGRVAMEGTCETDQLVIDIRGLAAGIYFLKIGEMEVKKVVKE